ncbi:hypothetical protein GQ44DRAFT_823730 [Phaeosphaeriaceae sp. PMI808]|nr:hypothetical protein GQ44DRAFT_823730 [Phaeosphaeriaceae sp. PMI808]
MLSTLSTLLFVGAVTAHITTSMPFLRSTFGTQVGFYGSVIGASDGQTTMVISYQNGTDWKALPFPEIWNQTVTVGPTMFVVRVPTSTRTGSATFTDKYAFELQCNVATASSDRGSICTASYGLEMAQIIGCPKTLRRSISSETLRTVLRTNLYTLSEGGTSPGGMGTTVQTVIEVAPTKPDPSYCSDGSYLPKTGLVETATVQIATYQVIITAGEEKLSATQGASASNSLATPTAASRSVSVSASVSGSTGAAMPLRTAAPIVVGLGAAIAVFVV